MCLTLIEQRGTVNCTHLERQVCQRSREVESFHRVPVI